MTLHCVMPLYLIYGKQITFMPRMDSLTNVVLAWNMAPLFYICNNYNPFEGCSLYILYQFHRCYNGLSQCFFSVENFNFVLLPVKTFAEEYNEEVSHTQ